MKQLFFFYVNALQGSCRFLNSLKGTGFDMSFQRHLKLLENDNFSLIMD